MQSIAYLKNKQFSLGENIYEMCLDTLWKRSTSYILIFLRFRFEINLLLDTYDATSFTLMIFNGNK